MVEKKSSEGSDEKLIEGRNLISGKNLLKYIRSNFEILCSRNIKSLQKIILPIQENILKIAEDHSYLENEVKM